jgi:hypothetical protein
MQTASGMKPDKQKKPAQDRSREVSREAGSDKTEQPRPREIGGREGLEPTRYGDWEKAGRCIDF